MPNVDFSDPWYPYGKLQTAYSSMRGAENITREICEYLMDLPDSNGYTPVDDNERPRVRLMKMLYYDDPNPLANPLPTVQQKLSVLYSGENPDLNTDEDKVNHPVGYRIYPLYTWQQAQLTAKSFLKCYIGRVIPNSPFQEEIGLTFDIIVGTGFETEMQAGGFSRAYAMETALIESLHGVNIDGIGTIAFDRYTHSDSGSSHLYNEAGNVVGRRVQMSVTWMDSVDKGSGC